MCYKYAIRVNKRIVRVAETCSENELVFAKALAKLFSDRYGRQGLRVDVLVKEKR
jgi:hypothetical protein